MNALQARKPCNVHLCKIRKQNTRRNVYMCKCVCMCECIVAEWLWCCGKKKNNSHIAMISTHSDFCFNLRNVDGIFFVFRNVSVSCYFYSYIHIPRLEWICQNETLGKNIKKYFAEKLLLLNMQIQHCWILLKLFSGTPYFAELISDLKRPCKNMERFGFLCWFIARVNRFLFRNRQQKILRNARGRKYNLCTGEENPLAKCHN